MLAEHQTARDHFREALALPDQAQMPLFSALTSSGAILCRRGGPRSALPAAEALRIADGCGALWHTERARMEWRRAGDRSGTTPPGQLPSGGGVARLAKVSKTSKRNRRPAAPVGQLRGNHLVHVYQRHTSMPMPEGSGAVSGRSRCGRPSGTLATSASEG